jgi:hypothetical protein
LHQNNSMDPRDQIHSFHIPVMGIAFTLDTPLKVARFGISSAISIMEDNLLEKMRAKYCETYDIPFTPISLKEDQYRSKRITAYLDLVHDIEEKQLTKLRNDHFDPNSEITKYFELLNSNSPLYLAYQNMLQTSDVIEQLRLQRDLRKRIQPGCIDVNIMTKLDNVHYRKDGETIKDGSDAVVALKGYADSKLSNSSVVLSAGMNPRLFNYMAEVGAFDPNAKQQFDKRVIIKVSNYRSALIQGMMLAKKGIWVSEYRVESGLNCGGHAFGSDGNLIGPILEEFKSNKETLKETLYALLLKSSKAELYHPTDSPPPALITFQGGIGSYEEDQILLNKYQVDRTGWGTPFLLVPEATTVDNDTLALLTKAKEKDLILSHNSPLGVRFHYLKGTSSEKEKERRITEGKPGSPCYEKFLVSDTEFTKEPICTASRTYQKKKIEQLQTLGLDETEYQSRYGKIVAKECLCIGLSNAAVKIHNLVPFKRLDGVNICPGPNIAHFSSIMSLKQIVDHIYGRHAAADIDRPSFIKKEISINIDFLSEMLEEKLETLNKKRIAYIKNFHENLLQGISYYQELKFDKIDFNDLSAKILDGLDEAESKIKGMFIILPTIEPKV